MQFSMGPLHKKPRNLDYVHFTRVDNSAAITSASSQVSETAKSSNSIVATIKTVKMAAGHVLLKIMAVAMLVFSIVVLAVVVAFLVSGQNSNLDSASSQNQTRSLSTTESTITYDMSTVSTRDTTITYDMSTLSTRDTTITYDMSTLSTRDTTITYDMSTLSTKSTTSCQNSEFACSNTTCLPLELACNGVPDCIDGSDESISCACTSHQFQCSSGQCFPLSAVCDEVYDCLDKTDEANCPDCSGFRCQSNNVCLWDRMARKCNQVFDCDDYSDELECQTRPGQHLCSNGVQIKSVNLCDGLDDCGDNSDEENCVCKEKRQFACSGEKGKCIPFTWVCDGHPDCPDGADEEECGVCSKEDFRCADNSCVNNSVRCDGKVDCAISGGDEEGCVELDSFNELRLSVAGQMLPVCSDGWSDKQSSWVCTQLHASTVLSWNKKTPLSRVTQFAVLKDSNVEPGVTNFHTSDACPSEAVIHVRCQDAGCGERKLDVLESYVAGGNLASLGKWPWVVSLAYLDKPICGGVLISDRWVLTAAHCIMYPIDGNYDYTMVPFYFTVTLGAVVISRNVTSASAHVPQVVRVSKIVFHPERALLDSGGIDWDIALLQLETTVSMSDVVQPVCLPSQGQVFLPTAYCYLAGWGLVSFRQYVRANQLRDARMQLWSESRCHGNIVVGEKVVNTNSTLCAGYMFGRPSGCQGDSGGPLFCHDSGRYVLAGIVSRGNAECGHPRPYARSNRFARVAMAVTWIQETIRTHS